MKRGDPRVIGALAYLTPLLSTLLLVLVGGGRFTPLAGCAMGLIVAGAVVGSLGMFQPPPKEESLSCRTCQAVAKEP
jgi:drug/metabolite transporter (DMT)-like permease